MLLRSAGRLGDFFKTLFFFFLFSKIFSLGLNSISDDLFGRFQAGLWSYRLANPLKAVDRDLCFSALRYESDTQRESDGKLRTPANQLRRRAKLKDKSGSQG